MLIKIILWEYKGACIVWSVVGSAVLIFLNLSVSTKWGNITSKFK